MTFKVGDFVKCIDPHDSGGVLWHNTKYEIVKVRSDDEVYIKNGSALSWRADRFELWDQKESKHWMRCTRIKAGKEIEVPLEQVWNSIVKVIGRARLLCNPDDESYIPIRRAYLNERLRDLEDISFHELSEDTKI